MDTPASPQLILGLAFAAAFLFGAIGQRTHFCTMGAVSDIVNMGDWNRMRQWLLAIAIAILGSTLLHYFQWIDLDKSIYRDPRLNWLAHLTGGLCFGVGMVLASGCGSKTLIRIGAGNLKSLVVLLVSAISAYATMRGLFAVFRVNVLEQAHLSLEGLQDIPRLVSSCFNLSPELALLLSSGTLVGILLLVILRHRTFWSINNLLGGMVTGGLVVACWFISGHLGYVPEDPNTLEELFLTTNSGRMESLTFVAPQAYSLELFVLWSDASRKLSFGIATLFGVICGSGCYAIATRTFRWEGFRDIADMKRHLLGAVLMGFGGVTALGCTIGQGMTGLSTLAIGSLLSFFAIIAGAWLTLRYQLWQVMRN